MWCKTVPTSFCVWCKAVPTSLDPVVQGCTHLFRVRVEGDAHVEQVAALLHAGQEGVHAVLEQPRLPVDLLRVAFPGLRELVRRRQQLVRVRHRVLQAQPETRVKYHSKHVLLRSSRKGTGSQLCGRYVALGRTAVS